MVSHFSEAFLLETERHAAWGAAQLAALDRFLPEAPWTADLPSRTFQKGDVELRVSVIGTYDVQRRSWMWGWANPGLRGTEIVALGGDVRRYGRVHGIGELTEDILLLGGFDDPRHAAELLAFTAMGVVGAPGYIGVMGGPETRVYFLPEDDRVPRPAPHPVTLPRVLHTGAGLIALSARTVVGGYFEHHGIAYEDFGDLITAELPDGSAVEVRLDEEDRITGIDVKAAGTPEAAAAGEQGPGEADAGDGTGEKDGSGRPGGSGDGTGAGSGGAEASGTEDCGSAGSPS